MSELSRFQEALEQAYIIFPSYGVSAGCCRDQLMIEAGQQQVIKHFSAALGVKDFLGVADVPPTSAELRLRAQSRSI